MSRDDPQINVRIPSAILSRIQSIARRERRSLTAQVVMAIEQFIAHDDRREKARARHAPE